MKILLIGANGQLGTDIQKVFSSEDIIPLTHQDIEICDIKSVKETIEGFLLPYVKIDAVINTAAYHNVSECDKNFTSACMVNGFGVKNLADVCERNNIILVHISTDYVFDGWKGTPYTENDITHPINAYGMSKTVGEAFVGQVKKYYIIRTASLFGTAGCRAKKGKNFVENMLDQSITRSAVQVASNIISSPTYTLDLAFKIKEILNGNCPFGVYHITNHGQCSWYEFAQEIFRQSHLDIKVEPVTGEIINRPINSALASTKLLPLRSWQEALAAYLEERQGV